ncbi:RsmB/NOP family class I SAM-dependent RNA methyltransferase [Magnetospirillum sp. UT-4]|uniref:RsmB/NOP family class I SAM-dependent RNA methyltransferase n=1 Tax=Magnetospirillum sp. UT-4 TaxID=2681467 RepID=UPI00137EF7D1|nr:transcription antitermination factor NusB [Magnetospirillum sp. UT-4]CAA7612161.1 putative ribosomal RNA small subunit methyltransferase B [Magnetospirillum sp. UT-4]
MNARTIALELLDAVLAGRHLLDEALESDKRLAALEPRDRAFARLLAATVLRRLGQLDDLIGRCLDRPLPARSRRVMDVLRLGAVQLLFLDTPPHAAISATVDLVKGGPLNGFAKLVNAVLRRLDREGRAWAAAQDAGRLNTPDWLWRSWCAAYGKDTARAIAEAHLHEAPVDITAMGDPAFWAERLQAELLPTGSLRRAAGGDVTALPGFAEGAWWVQDMAAAIPARLLGEVAGKRVADLCAAPGGKALQLAAAGALVTAVDRSARRLERVRQNLDRLKLEADMVAADVAAWRPESPFDAVLLDAPCTATGTLRRHPDGLRLKGPGDVAALADQQAALLRAALEMLKPGGTLVYCVCSLEPEEGVAQVERLLAAGAVERLPVRPEEVGGLAELLTPAGDLRTLPCHMAELGGMDGFYAARLVRAATA